MDKLLRDHVLSFHLGIYVGVERWGHYVRIFLISDSQIAFGRTLFEMLKKFLNVGIRVRK